MLKALKMWKKKGFKADFMHLKYFYLRKNILH